MPTPFVHLHCHSHYSLLRALPQIKALVKRAQEQGMTALALTDYSALYGAIEFYQACTKAGIKPIIGVEAYLAPNKHTDRRPRIDDRPYQIVLLAKDEAGYKNLLKLTTIAHLEGFYYKPRIDKDLLRTHHEGLICLSGGLNGDLAKALEMQDQDKAEAIAREYADIFGPDNFYIEVQDHPELDEQRLRNDELIALADKLQLPIVATKDVHYLHPADAEAHDVLVCIGAGVTVQQDNRSRMLGADYSLVDGDHMAAAFAARPDAIENTVKIAERCNLEIELGKWKFASYPIPADKTYDEVLREFTYAGIAEKLPEITDEIRKRLDYELDVIAKKGYAVYFLVVSDFIKWSRRRGIVSTTRGSAAGSLVSYAIDIVPVNPLYFKLPFERFLNPFRPSAPDIDADFADDRRDEVIAYVTEKYGFDKVAQIGTFGSMAARAAVRDVGRAFGLPYGLVDRVAKLIPMGSQGFAMTIARALEESVELKDFADTDPNVRRLLELAQKVEGCARHVSVHAAGVVISPEPLTEYCPLQREPGGEKIITQYDMNSVGEDGAGVLKMDFLGIRNLSILGLAVKIVKQTKNIDIELNKLPYDDALTYEKLAEGHTVGLFQLGGSGMTRYLMELKPTNIYDIQAMVALYRPGPMESIPEYIRRKHDPSLISYLHPLCESYMKESLGVMVYQDDVMLTAIHLAGYDWMEADKFRKAIGKKIPTEMAKQEVKFRAGCKTNGISDALADHCWELFKPFAGYGFNKAHAASYAVVAYHTAYMKAHFPSEFMTAVLSAEAGDTEKTVEVLEECRRIGLNVLPPEINASTADYRYVDDATIRFGLKAIKNLGEDTIAEIVAARDAGESFVDLADFAARVGSKGFNRRALEALIKSGAMDSLGERNALLANVDQVLDYHRNLKKEADSGQYNLFGDGTAVRPPLTLRPAPPATKREKLAWERELLGLYISEHPFKDYADFFGTLVTKVEELPVKSGQPGLVRVGGFIFDVRQILTKKGDPMAFVQLGDPTGQVELVVFPRTLKEFADALTPDTAVLVEAKVEEKEGQLKLICENVKRIDMETAEPLRAHLAYYLSGGRTSAGGGPAIECDREELCLKVPPKLRQSFIVELKRVLIERPGNRRVFLVFETDGQLRKVDTKISVAFNGETIKAIETVLGSGAVLVE